MARVLQICADAKMSGSFGVDRVWQTGRGGLMNSGATDSDNSEALASCWHPYGK